MRLRHSHLFILHLLLWLFIFFILFGVFFQTFLSSAIFKPSFKEIFHIIKFLIVYKAIHCHFGHYFFQIWTIKFKDPGFESIKSKIDILSFRNSAYFSAILQYKIRDFLYIFFSHFNQRSFFRIVFKLLIESIKANIKSKKLFKEG